MAQRLVRLALGNERIGEIIEGAEQVRLDRKRPAIVLDRFVGTAALGEGIGEIVVRFRAHLEGEHAFVAGDRIRKPALILEQIAQVPVRLDIVRLERGRAPVMLGGFVDPAQLLQGERHVVVAFRHSVVHGKRLADGLDRHGRAARLQRDNAEVVQGAKVPWVDGENLVVKPLGLQQLSSLVVADRERERFVAVGGGRWRRPPLALPGGGAPIFAVHGHAALTGNAAGRRRRPRAFA